MRNYEQPLASILVLGIGGFVLVMLSPSLILRGDFFGVIMLIMGGIMCLSSYIWYRYWKKRK